MNIALIGYGKMGHAIEALAIGRGHAVTVRIDKDDPWPVENGEWKVESGVRPDVAIEFTTPATAVGNIERCLELGLPVVCGTTGWYAGYDAVTAKCRACGGRLLTATNFSIGMNIMFALNERLAQLMRGRDDYSVSISETHHIHKLDAPSGTAITLQEQIVASGQRPAESIPISSYREGEVPGTHTVVYDSEIDTLTLTHEAHSRQGLAQGALLAAEWLVKAEAGVYTMKDILS
ncbi:MAG: 4-hydroxy-tetrahydrodipicolinate reductase [Bacteroidales bacterium]|nr:4-hydroxy-tetrahydrodipicolinate reductase [Bacteroidales bacterium]